MSVKRKSAGAVLAVLGVLCVPCLSSCTHNHGVPYLEGDDARGDSGSGSGTDAGIDWSCPEPPTAECNAEGWPGAFDSSFQTTDLGEGYSFVEVEGEMVFLAERPDIDGGTEPVVVTRSGDTLFDELPGEWAIVALEIEPFEPLRAVGLVSYRCIYSSEYGFMLEGNIIGYPAVTLLCGDSGCRLYAVIVDSTYSAHLSQIPNGEVPIADAQGLILREPADYDDFENNVCAFGDGIACFDGTTWSTMLEPGGPILLAATTYWESWHTYLIASGEACRLVRQTGEGFEEIPLGCDVDLKTVSGGYRFFTAGGSGVVVFILLGETLECPMDGLDFALVHAAGAAVDEEKVVHYHATAFVQDGRVVELRHGDVGENSCTFAEPLDGPARDLTEIAPWADAYGSMVVTESSAYWRIEGGGPPD